MTSKWKRLFDIDQLLIFFLLAVTVNQMGHYLSTFAPAGLGFVGYLQAVGIDAAIWRSAYWFRRYTGKNQRRWSLIGILAFSIVSTWYNRNYYAAHPELGQVVPWLMGIVLPIGVALLSYLNGQKDDSRFGTDKDKEKARAEKERLAQLVAQGICRICEAQVGAELLSTEGLCPSCQRRKEGKTHSVTESVAIQVFQRDHWACYYCGADVSEVGARERHFDHFFPRSLGGEDIPDNLVTSCQGCNLHKSDTVPTEDEQRQFALYLRASRIRGPKKNKVVALLGNELNATQSDIAKVLKTSQGYVSSIAKAIANNGHGA